MNKAERQELILNKLKVDHHVYISDLCQELDTSYDSIRRDITELDAAGKLKRVHGGAIAKGGLPLEYVNRSDLESNAKQQLAHKAIELFHDGDILLIDGEHRMSNLSGSYLQTCTSLSLPIRCL